MSALLGYQFERALHQSDLDRYIDTFRTQFPLVAHKETPAQDGEAAEAVAARNVVDGLALARADKDKLRKTLQDKQIEAHQKNIRELNATMQSQIRDYDQWLSKLDAE